jgi:hypothetical protein
MSIPVIALLASGIIILGAAFAKPSGYIACACALAALIWAAVAH